MADPRIGYSLSTEEHGPRELVGYARRAEEVGFAYLSISDHYHPWIDAQGSSPFVWTVIGGIAEATERIPLGTGVTCPTGRYQPAVVAQMAATAATAPRRAARGSALARDPASRPARAGKSSPREPARAASPRRDEPGVRTEL